VRDPADAARHVDDQRDHRDHEQERDDEAPDAGRHQVGIDP
jgi:hypothetical protein